MNTATNTAPVARSVCHAIHGAFGHPHVAFAWRTTMDCPRVETCAPRALAARLVVATPANDAHHTPAAPVLGSCIACHQYPGDVEAHGLCDVCANEVVPATVGNRCPGGCSAGLIEDPHGQSRWNPCGLRPCPVCG